MSKYTLNLAPLKIDGNTKVIIGRQPYDPEQLIELRGEFGETHVFHRDAKDNVILDLAVTPKGVPIGNVQEEMDLALDRRLRPALLSATLMKAFTGARDLLSDRPVSVIGPVGRGLLRHPDLPE